MAAREYIRTRASSFTNTGKTGLAFFSSSSKRARIETFLVARRRRSFLPLILFFFFPRSPHVRGAYSIRKERGFHDSRFFSLTLWIPSLFRRSLFERASATRLVFACVSRHVPYSLFPPAGSSWSARNWLPRRSRFSDTT